MQTHRLYIKTLIEPGNDFYIENTKAHYIKQVLRLKENNFITVFDGSGHEYEAVIKELYKNKILLAPSTSKFYEQKIKRQIHLGQSLIKKDKMDMLIQKLTELGTLLYILEKETTLLIAPTNSLMLVVISELMNFCISLEILI